MLNGEKRLVGEQTYKTVNGEIKLFDLVLREYFILEKTPPQGFEMAPNPGPISVKVEKAAGENNVNAYTHEITNNHIKIDVTGKKIWVGGPEVKPTIGLQLFRDGKVFGQAVTLENGTLTHTWKDLNLTDSKGVEYVYTVDEVEVPTGYIKSISEDGLTITNTFVDSSIRGQLVINKVDSQTGEVLDGAIFELRREDETVIGTLTTDEDGKAVAEDLSFGKYILEETKAPSGYLLGENTTYEFSIVEDKQQVNLTIKNDGKLPDTEGEPSEPDTGGKPSLPDGGGKPSEPTPGKPDLPATGKPTLPATGSSSNIPLYLLGISLVALGSVALLRKRKLNS